MRVAILTQYYPPEHGAPQNRLHDLARRLAAKGVEVRVLTAMPNYPGGEVFPEYKGRFMSEEEIDGMGVLRSWIRPSKSKGKIPMLACYFSFVFSSLLVGLLKLRRSDWLVVESPPLFLGFTAIILKFLKGARLVTNVSDLWPESAVQLGMIGKGPALSALEWFERFLYRRSAFVSCQTEGIVDGVRRASPGTDAFLFPNGVDLEMFGVLPRSRELAAEFGLREGCLIVGYGGNHGRSQALTQVLDAARILRGEKVHFALFGDGPEKESLVERARSEGLENVSFHPSQPRQKMNGVQAQWDVALAPLKNIELFNGARPSKMFELMAGGIPFVFCGRGEGADLAEASGCAVAVPPEEPEKLAEAIRGLAALGVEGRRRMGESGRRFVAEKFNRAQLAEKFLEKLEDGLRQG